MNIQKFHLLKNLLVLVNDYGKPLGNLGAILGTLIVIIYCGSIGFLPSGLAISDVLFFLWVSVVSGTIYIVIALAFYMSALFWFVVFVEPVNWILRYFNGREWLNEFFLNKDKIGYIALGFVANIIIFFKALELNLVMFNVGLAIFFNIVFIILISFIDSDIKELEDFKRSDKNEGIQGTKSATPINFLYLLIFLSPIFVGYVGNAFLKTSFSVLGIRQHNVNLVVDRKAINKLNDLYFDSDFANAFQCDKNACLIANATILFGSVGSSTKILVGYQKSSIEFTLNKASIFLIYSNPE